MVFAHTMVLAPNHGSSKRAAAISAPRLAVPTKKTMTSSRKRGRELTSRLRARGERTGRIATVEVHVVRNVDVLPDPPLFTEELPHQAPADDLPRTFNTFTLPGARQPCLLYTSDAA